MCEEWIHYFEKPHISVVQSFEGDSNEFLNGNVLHLHSSKKIDWDKVNIAILGVDDRRGLKSKDCQGIADKIRASLYGLRTSGLLGSIVDLGNVKGNTLDDRYRAIEDVLFELTSRHILAIVIGGGQDYSLPLSRALSRFDKRFQMTFVDSKIDWNDSEGDFSASNYLSVLCNNAIKKIEDLTFIGTQRYFVSPKQEAWVFRNNFGLLRLGEVRQKGIGSTESWLRDADCISIDMSCVQQFSANPQINPIVNGLSSEDICQMAWYSGLSDKMKIVGVFEIDASVYSILLSAQLIWHTIEAYFLRYNDYPVRNVEEYKQFIVHLDHSDLVIKFYTNPDNDRWWMEFDDENQEKLILACEKADFELASTGDMPHKWMRYIQKKQIL